MSKQRLCIHCIQHVSFEGIGYIEDWAKENDHHLSYSLLYEKLAFPSQDEFDWLIIMGGPMNIYEEDIYPWLKAEKQFIRESINSNKTVLGFCLGSQLIADVLGAKVKRNRAVEIGWFSICLTKDGLENNLFGKLDFNESVFHWHGDTFDIPDKSVRIAYSSACDNQAFIYKDRVIGFQFHLEVTPYSLANMIDNGKDELRESQYIQTESEILKYSQNIGTCNKILKSILDSLASKSI